MDRSNIDLKNVKIDMTGRSEEEKKEFQQACFDQGMKWRGSDDHYINLNEDIFSTDYTHVFYSSLDSDKDITKEWFSKNVKSPIISAVGDDANIDYTITEGEEMDEPIKRPPLGIEPEYIWKEIRIIELIRAIYRYDEADIDVNNDWIIELGKLIPQVFSSTTKPNMENIHKCFAPHEEGE